VLLARTKIVIIDNHPVRLFSLDGGKLWFSDPRSYREFKRRIALEKRTCQSMIAAHVPANFLVVPADMDDAFAT
jgi:hypothetical protein